MADDLTFTQKVDKFFDNNTPGGYIQTTVNISNSDIDSRINTAIQNKGFLTSTSHISWNNIDNKPSLFSGNYNDLTNKPRLFSGNYNDLTNKPNIPTINISNTLNNGTRLATITINGINTDIYGAIDNDEDNSVFLNSPAAHITNTDINNWNNKSNFNGDYNELNNLPNLFDFEVINLDTDYPEVNLNTSTTMELANNNCIQTIQQIIQNGQLPILKQQSNYYLINNYSIENNTYFRATFIDITDTFEDAVVNHSDNIINYVKIHKFFIHIFFYDILNNKSYLKNSQILNDYVTQYDYDISIGEIWDAINELQQSS